MKFWAILGSQGCIEKKPPNCNKYPTFWGDFFNFFLGKKNMLASAQKSYII